MRETPAVLKRLVRGLWRWSVRLGAGAIIGMALLVGLFRVLLPLTPAYHAQIERWAGEALDVRVVLNEVDARWPLLGGPELVFSDATLWSPDGQALLLSAERGAVALDLFALVSQLALKPGRVLLEGVVIDVAYRSDKGGWQVLGRPLVRAPAAPAPARRAREVLPRGTLDLQDATIVVEDDRLATQAVSRVTGVDLTYEYRRGALKVDGTLQPAGPASRLDFSMQGDGLRDGEIPSWQYFVDARSIDLTALTGVPVRAVGGLAGRGDMRLWTAIRNGRLQQGTLDVALEGLTLEPADGAGASPATVAYDEFSGHFDLSVDEAGGWTLRGERIGVARDGRHWPETSLTVAVAEHGLTSIKADHLRLDDLAPLAPLAAAAEMPGSNLAVTLLQTLPSGDLSRLRVDRSADGALKASVRVQALAVRGAARGAGVSGLSGTLRMARDSATLELDAPSLVFHQPALFPAALPAMAVNGSIEWRRQDGRHQFRSMQLDIVAPALRASSSLELQIPIPGPAAAPEQESGPWLELQTRIRDVDAALLSAYVPAQLLPHSVASWLQKALVAGRIPEATASFVGPIKAFPFEQNEGRFEAWARVEDIEFDYARGWPRAVGLGGEVSFTNARMVGEGTDGSTLGNALRALDVEIADLREGVIRLRSRTAGSVPAVIGYLRGTPYAANVELVDASAGDGEVVLDLTLPLRKLEDTRLAAALELDGGRLALKGMPAALEEIAGQLRFDTNNGLQGNAIAARFLDEPVQIDVTAEKDEAGQLLASRLELVGAYDLGALLERLNPAFTDIAEGASDVRATVRLRPGSERLGEVELASDLSGTALKLPSPLEKPAAGRLDTMLRVRASPDGGAFVALDAGLRVRARARVGKPQPQGTPGVTSAAVALGGSAPGPLPEGAIRVDGRTGLLDVDGWIGLAARALVPGTAPSAPAGTTVADARPAGPEPIPSAAGLPRVDLALEVDEALVAGQRLRRLSLASDQDRNVWGLRVVGDGIAGSLFLPAGPHDAFVARFEQLHLPGAWPATESARGGGQADSDGEATAMAASSAQLDPRRLPTLVARVDDFAWGDLQLGRVEVELQSGPTGVSLPRLLAQAPTFSIEGTGDWTIGSDGEHRSGLELTLRTSDLLTTLEQLDFEGTLSAEEASLQAALNWAGPPSSTLDERLSGRVSVAIGPGQLMNVRPGAGKIFGLMSVAALPRRLELDFRDVFEKGLGFDQITGSFVIDRGQAYTDDLTLLGQTADVTIVGRTGLLTRDYDQTAVVSANVGTTLPIAGALAGGPVVGAALLIFSEIMKEPLKELSRTQYHITGPWDDPSVERVALPNATQREVGNGSGAAITSPPSASGDVLGRD
jgi:uncharacterized protein (TIGR02099 family)